MKIAHNYYVYIVQCNDGFYYTGVTNNLERRIAEHNVGINPNCFTYKRRPVVLKYYEHFQNVQNAIAWEKQLKGWSRKKKEALFNNDFETIKQLAKSKILRQAQDDSLRKLRVTGFRSICPFCRMVGKNSTKVKRKLSG